VSEIPHAFATAVRAARKRKGLTQLALAEKAGTSLDAINAVGREVNVPTIETAAKLIKVLEIDPAVVFGPDPRSASATSERKAIEAKVLRLLEGIDDRGASLLLQLAMAVAATHAAPKRQPHKTDRM